MSINDTSNFNGVRASLPRTKANPIYVGLGVLGVTLMLPMTAIATSTESSMLSNLVSPADVVNMDYSATPKSGPYLAKQGTYVSHYPQTPHINPDLPVVQTTRKSAFLKANILNPFPICNSLEDKRTVVYKVTDNWLPVGTISTFNNTNTEIPLTQTTSRTQSITMSVNGSQTESISVNLGGDVSGGEGVTGGGSTGIAYSLARTIGGDASYSLSWNVGQQIGPYMVPAGYTGEATYGFRAVNMTGTSQYCLSNGTWSTPTAWRAFVPIKNEIKVSMFDNLVDSIDTSAPSYNFSMPIPTPPSGVDMTKPLLTQDYDLKPHLTVSKLKAPGFAGSVALKVKNTGLQDYYGEFPIVSYLVQVKTVSGPQGVDRLITTSGFKGAYVQDLGFDKQSSTRSFLVTLSNPIISGDEVTLAAFSFNDGLTKLGRLKNKIVVSQIGRIAGDTSYYNDQYVDSLSNTLSDFGNPTRGIF